MPVAGEDWVVPPFAAEIVDAPRAGLPAQYGPCLVARGASNQKGPLACVIGALRSIRAVTGDLPLNVLFVVEGEEEIASPHMAAFRDRYLAELRQADAAYFPNPYQDERGRAQIHLGTKGLVSVELRVRGGDWGGPAEGPRFAADSVWLDEPAWHLVWALATLKDRDGRIQLPGLAERLRPLTPAEQEQLARLRADFDQEGTRQRLGARRFRAGRSPLEYFEAFTSGPVLNLDGYQSGYTGPFIKTTLPDSAFAKLDIRLVPDMDKEDVKRALRAHLDAHGFEHVELRYNGAYNWSKTDLEAGVVQAAIAASRAHGVDVAIWPMTYYCAPTVVFNEPPLGLPVTDAGLGYMGRFHAANEYFTIESMRAYEKWLVTFLHAFAAR